MKRKRDWPLIIGILAGAFVGAVAIAYFATNQFYLYRIGSFHPTAIPTNSTLVGQLPVVYDWPSIWLWASVGLVVGAFLGALAVALLRAVNRHQTVSK